jgi:hypothetical protein
VGHLGGLSCAAWLADCCDIEVGTARTQVRVARAMRQFPALDQAIATGDVSYAKARVLAAYLTPENAGAVCAAIDTTVTRNHAPAGASLAHQRADALVTLMTDGGGSVTAELVIHVNAEGNTLTDGTPLSDHAVAGLLPDAFISLLLHDNQGRPIDASPRRRLPTRPPDRAQ